MLLNSAFQGITTPLPDLYHEIHSRGWQVSKVDTKNGEYVAEAKNPHGESVSKTGRDAATALAALLVFIVRREHIRQGAWTKHWGDQLEPIAQAYAKSPVFDPKAALAWKELADDCVARAAVLQNQIQVELTHDPVPYASPQDMWEDVQKKKHLTVSDADSEHPVWTRDQVIAFRICHDVLGHSVAGGDFGWTGANLAAAAHMPLLTPNAQKALFSETVGKKAYQHYHRGLGPHKITFLNEFLDPLQDSENPDGHGGEHPSMSLVPGTLPTRSAGVRRDPNAGYVTDVVPPGNNAITAWGDPLEHMKVKDNAHALNTDWHTFKDGDGKPDHGLMKQAVVNAFKAALLSPQKQLKWNAVHYQDMMHIPHHVTDPKVYYDALENARINWNKAKGVPDPEIHHKDHYEALLDFYRYVHAHNPELHPTEVRNLADREVMVMQAECEEQILHKSKENDYELIAPKVLKLLDRRLKLIMKDDKPLHTGSALDSTHDPSAELYGASTARHSIAIGKVAKYGDILLEAALEDVKNHGGKGHTFRSTALGLNLPHVDPKCVSFAWLLLQPLTSQLATVDTHTAEALGHKHKDVANNRDYFRLERELMAGRDAAGYGHMPLGQFQWGLWDHKRSGPGQHSDYSPLRPWQPKPHHQVEWGASAAVPGRTGEEWIAPEWWKATQPYREAEITKWNHDVAPLHPNSAIPYKDDEALVHIASEESDDELHLALDVPEWVRKKLSLFTTTLGLPADAQWLDPAEYHVTIAYAPHGVKDVDIDRVTNSFNLTGLKFTGKHVTKLGDAGALVAELECDNFNEYAERINEWLEEQGVQVSRYPGGFTPHITLAYYEGEVKDAKLPPLSFRAGRMSFSTPRGATPMPALTAAVNDLVCPGCKKKVEPEWKNCPYCQTSFMYNKPKVEGPGKQQDAFPGHQMFPLEVQHMDGDARPRYEGYEYGQRMPTAYDSANNKLYIGPTGIWHMDLGRHFGIGVAEGEYGNAVTDNDPNFYVGYINLKNKPDRDDETHEYDLEGAEMGWYHRTPDNADDLRDNIGIKPPAPEEQFSDEEIWGDFDDDTPATTQQPTQNPVQNTEKPTPYVDYDHLPTIAERYGTWGDVPVGTVVVTTSSNANNSYIVVEPKSESYISLVTNDEHDPDDFNNIYEKASTPSTVWKVWHETTAPNQPEVNEKPVSLKEKYPTWGEVPVGAIISTEDDPHLTYKVAPGSVTGSIDLQGIEDNYQYKNYAFASSGVTSNWQLVKLDDAAAATQHAMDSLEDDKKHAVFAVCTDTTKYKLSEWLDWDSAQELFDTWDNELMGERMFVGGEDKEVSYLAVRSFIDPNWNGQPEGDLISQSALDTQHEQVYEKDDDDWGKFDEGAIVEVEGYPGKQWEVYDVSEGQVPKVWILRSIEDGAVKIDAKETEITLVKADPKADMNKFKPGDIVEYDEEAAGKTVPEHHAGKWKILNAVPAAGDYKAIGASDENRNSINYIMPELFKVVEKSNEIILFHKGMKVSNKNFPVEDGYVFIIQDDEPGEDGRWRVKTAPGFASHTDWWQGYFNSADMQPYEPKTSKWYSRILRRSKPIWEVASVSLPKTELEPRMAGFCTCPAMPQHCPLHR